jgi:hypothetical protein
MSFTTINKVDANGFICKLDVYETREQADARIAELHQMAGYEDAFIVDNGATAVDGKQCFGVPKHWPVDQINKTVSFDQAAFDADKFDDDMKILRTERNKRLEASDIVVLPDRWAQMDDDSKTAWTNYRQALRDLPETVDINDWPDITWPTEPS